MNGYEASLFNNLLETPHFKDYFQVENSGVWTGIVSSMYEIGSFTAFPFIGPALDTFGRKVWIVDRYLDLVHRHSSPRNGCSDCISGAVYGWSLSPRLWYCYCCLCGSDST